MDSSNEDKVYVDNPRWMKFGNNNGKEREMEQ